MSTAFTTITRGNDLQGTRFLSAMTIEEMQALANKTILDEIYLAYYERRMVKGESPDLPVSFGMNTSDVSFIKGMQDWCESNCTSFIDHVRGPLNADGTAFLYFTLATWRAAAGLNASGFRRSTDGTTMLYGKIAAGDVRGSWCFEDLQKGFSALRRGTGFTSASYWCHVNYKDSRGLESEMGPAWDVDPMECAGIDGRWTYLYGAALSFRSHVGFHYPGHFFASVWCSAPGDIPQVHRMSRKRVNITFRKIAGLSGSADIYFRGKSYPDWGTPIPFEDIDGLGLVNGSMLFYTTLASMDNVETGLLGGEGIFLLGSHRAYSCDIFVNRKWDFTNQNV